MKSHACIWSLPRNEKRLSLGCCGELLLQGGPPAQIEIVQWLCLSSKCFFVFFEVSLFFQCKINLRCITITNIFSYLEGRCHHCTYTSCQNYDVVKIVKSSSVFLKPDRCLADQAVLYTHCNTFIRRKRTKSIYLQWHYHTFNVCI